MLESTYLNDQWNQTDRVFSEVAKILTCTTTQISWILLRRSQGQVNELRPCLAPDPHLRPLCTYHWGTNPSEFLVPVPSTSAAVLCSAALFLCTALTLHSLWRGKTPFYYCRNCISLIFCPNISNSRVFYYVSGRLFSLIWLHYQSKQNIFNNNTTARIRKVAYKIQNVTALQCLNTTKPKKYSPIHFFPHFL